MSEGRVDRLDQNNAAPLARNVSLLYSPGGIAFA
jgi:hypothetical protein